MKVPNTQEAKDIIRKEIIQQQLKAEKEVNKLMEAFKELDQGKYDNKIKIQVTPLWRDRESGRKSLHISLDLIKQKGLFFYKDKIGR